MTLCTRCSSVSLTMLTSSLQLFWCWVFVAYVSRFIIRWFSRCFWENLRQKNMMVFQVHDPVRDANQKNVILSRPQVGSWQKYFTKSHNSNWIKKIPRLSPIINFEALFCPEISVGSSALPDGNTVPVLSRELSIMFRNNISFGDPVCREIRDIRDIYRIVGFRAVVHNLLGTTCPKFWGLLSWGGRRKILETQKKSFAKKVLCFLLWYRENAGGKNSFS